MNTKPKSNKKILGWVGWLLVISSILLMLLPEHFTSSLLPLSHLKIEEEIINQVAGLGLVLSLGLMLVMFYSRKFKAFFFNMMLVIFMLSIAELFVFAKEPGRLIWAPQNSMPCFESSDTLGYQLRPNVQARSTCYFKDSIFLYDVTYTTNKDRQRITTNEPHLYDSTEQSIVFLGCSFTFGTGLDDHETMPFQIQQSVGEAYKVYNLGVTGYGPHNVLAQIDNGVVEEKVRQKPAFFVLNGIQDHLRRIHTPDQKNFEIHSPKYALDSRTGDFTYQGLFDDDKNHPARKFFSRLRRSSLLNYLTRGRTENDLITLYVEYVKGIKASLGERYPDVPFHLVYWDNWDSQLDTKMIKALRNADISVHIMSHIIPYYFYSYDKYVVKFPYEFHPSAEANMKLAEYLNYKVFFADDYYAYHNQPFLDELDSLDEEKWEIEAYSVPFNGAEMKRTQTNCKSGAVILKLENNDVPEEKPFKSGGISQRKYHRYGNFSVRMKANLASGTMAYINLINQWQEKLWEQKSINIQFFGKEREKVLLSVQRYETDAHEPDEVKKVYDLGFDPSAEFHTYSICWSQKRIDFLVDGETVFSQDSILFDQEMSLAINQWAGSENNPGLMHRIGEINTGQLPSTVTIESVGYKPLVVSKQDEADTNPMITQVSTDNHSSL